MSQDIIELIYNRPKSIGKTSDMGSSAFPPGHRTKQGDPLSPHLYESLMGITMDDQEK